MRPRPLGLPGMENTSRIFKIRANLLQMAGGEVTPIVRIKHIRDAANDPARILFAPNCLTQRQGCVQRGWVFEREKIPSHSPAVIVDHRREPRLGCLAIWTDQ